MSDSLNVLQEQVAQALLDCGAVVFTPHEPITFKSGIRAPVYVDNRRLPFWPDQWRVVIECFQQMIAAHTLAFDVIAGIEAAGIPHSAALAYALGRPSVFVRKQAKPHGTQSRIEGGAVRDRRVLLIEDLVTTGSSSLSGVAALRGDGALVEDCLCITTYGFPEARHAFDAAHVRLYPLTPFSAVVVEASRRGLFGQPELEVLEAWMRDPHGWTGADDADGDHTEP
ncbi:MAG: orotate phosphoribosyltransferase [Anaerolineae bacterium]|nr:orotate phosphoribosyltransferase [Anaerolineae bacterium]